MRHQARLASLVILGAIFSPGCKFRRYSDQASVSDTAGPATTAAQTGLLFSDPHGFVEGAVSRSRLFGGNANLQGFAEQAHQVVVDFLRQQGFNADASQNLSDKAVVEPHTVTRNGVLSYGTGDIVRFKFRLASLADASRTVDLKVEFSLSRPSVAYSHSNPNASNVVFGTDLIRFLIREVDAELQRDLTAKGELTRGNAIPESVLRAYAEATDPQAVAVRALARSAAEATWSERWSMGQEGAGYVNSLSPELRELLVREFAPEAIRERVARQNAGRPPAEHTTPEKVMVQELTRLQAEMSKSYVNALEVHRLARVIAEFTRRAGK